MLHWYAYDHTQIVPAFYEQSVFAKQMKARVTTKGAVYRAHNPIQCIYSANRKVLRPF